MSATPIVSTCALPPRLASWRSLVKRSITAWDTLTTDHSTVPKHHPQSHLEAYPTLNDFLSQCGQSLMFWFFHRRPAFLSQYLVPKWSADTLEDYILLPASPVFVMRADCFFISHFWDSPSHPDPRGTYLRLHQAQLRPLSWSYVWLDWSCMPQAPRSAAEAKYFERCLWTMSGIIQNCRFTYFYPPFQPRLWILYEIAEFVLTCDVGVEALPGVDIEVYHRHVKEMVENGVQSTLDKFGYTCSFERDRRHLTPWLELLVLLKQLRFDTGFVRKIMDHLTWFNGFPEQCYGSGEVVLNRYRGTLIVFGELHRFTPFPKRHCGKEMTRRT